jgi:hypothetical protein
VPPDPRHEKTRSADVKPSRTASHTLRWFRQSRQEELSHWAKEEINLKTPLLLFMTLATACVAFAAGNPALLPDGTSQEARNEAVARRVFEEIFNQGKFQVAEEIYATDFVNHGLRRRIDLREDQEAVRAEKQAFPDLNYKMGVNLMVAEGDLVTGGVDLPGNKYPRWIRPPCNGSGD